MGLTLVAVRVASQWQITSKNLLPILSASMVWGEGMVKRVVCHCDNIAIVEIMNANGGCNKDALLKQLLRSL